MDNYELINSEGVRMETVSCNLCGSEDYATVYEMPDTLFQKDEWFTVVACRRCGLGFVNPRPVAAEIQRYYPPQYYSGFERDQVYHLRRYARQAGFLESGVRSGGKRLLDVGCANGDFPRFMRNQGWQVEGVEVSSTTQRITDFPVYTQQFPIIPVADPCYDAVTAWAVLEHVHNPDDYFTKAAQVLRPGGAFIFLVTNFASLSSSRLFREDVPRHLYFFTEPTVRRYLSKHGFQFVAANFSDKIFAMQAYNWLHYGLKFRLRNRPFRYEDAQFCRDHYLTRRGLRPGFASTVRFLAANPHIAVDRVFRRAFEKYQMLTRTYGVVTYTAIKPR